jgi:basic membrane protein A
MYKNLVPAGALALAAVCFSLPVFSQPKPTGEPVKAGFVYVSPITDAGWTKQHDEGRKAVEAALGSQGEDHLSSKTWPRAPTPSA